MYLTLMLIIFYVPSQTRNVWVSGVLWSVSSVKCEFSELSHIVERFSKLSSKVTTDTNQATLGHYVVFIKNKSRHTHETHKDCKTSLDTMYKGDVVGKQF